MQQSEIESESERERGMNVQRDTKIQNNPPISPFPFNFIVHFSPINSSAPNIINETAYWAMNMNSYKFGLSAPGTTPYYGLYGVNDYSPRMDVGRRAWEYPSMSYIEEPTVTNVQSEENAVPTMEAIPEECTPNHDSAATSQLFMHVQPHWKIVWQDNIDPDNMTYEELLDLGEAVGTQNRGLPQELTDLLPTSRYKSGGLFLRKRSRERCVICQMRYKRGDHQIKLPCQQVYHTECGSQWLNINKACPICNTEVFGEDSRQ